MGLSGGYAQPLAAGDPFAGMAYEEINNTGGADGAKSVRVYTHGDFEHALGSASRANNGAIVYASADDTLTLTASGNSACGQPGGRAQQREDRAAVEALDEMRVVGRVQRPDWQRRRVG